MKKVYQLLYCIVIISFSVMCAISCNTVSPIDMKTDNKINDNIYQDFREFNKYPEEELFFVRAAWIDIEVYLMFADFCVIAEREVIKREPLAPKPEEVETNLNDVDTNKMTDKELKEFISRNIRVKFKPDPWDMIKIDERIKVHSVVFGDVPEKEFRISRVVDPSHDKPYYNNWYGGGYQPVCISISIPFSPPLGNKNQKMILFGRRGGADYEIGASLWAGQEVISLQAIKAIKDLIMKEDSVSEDAFQKEKQDLLDNSNNSELLSYLFRRSHLYVQKGNISETVEVIKRLSGHNPSMPNRKFLSYGFSLYVLYDLNDRLPMPNWRLNETQKQTLIDIATKKLSEVTSISEGLKYLRLIGMFVYDPTSNYYIENAGWPKAKWDKFNSPAPIDSPLFKKIPALKDSLKAVAQTLSKRFENDKDYPEWQKWVNKIFPEQSPK